MYFKHYHLTKKPFGLTPGPDFFWFSEKHKEALATLRYGIIGDLGFLLLTGEVGVGKTALIHRLLSSLDSSTIVAHITDPGLGINDFFKLLAVEFGIETPFTSKGEFLIILERFLYKAYEDQKKVLLIVDEAQRVNSTLLDQIRVLSNIELNDHKLINIFFIGQPEFKKTLMLDVNRPIRQRIAIYYHVQPLDSVETGQYIEHRLEIAGAKHQIFTPDALREIHRIAQGYPRAINILCDHALLTGYSMGKQTIDATIVKECENELNIDADFDPPPKVAPSRTPPPEITGINIKTGAVKRDLPKSDLPPPKQSKAWYYPAVFGIAVLLVALAGYFILWPGPSQTPPTQEETPGPMTFKTPAPPADEAAAPPELSDAGKQLASNDSHTEANEKLNPGQNAVEPKPPAETTKTAPALAVPEPPPQVSMKTTETAPVDGPAAHSAPPPKAVSSETASEPTAKVEPGTRQQSKADVPAGEPAGQSVKQPPSSASGQPIAPTEPVANTQRPPASAPAPVAEPPLGDQASASGNAPPETNANAPTVKPDAVSPPAAAPTPKITVPASDATRPAAEKALPATPAAPSIPATAALQPQAIENVPSAAQKPKIDETLESRVRSFLQAYCNTYSSKDLDSFGRFFAPDALENGKSFKSLLPKYQKNFTFIDTIYYRIEMQQLRHDENGKMLKIDGDFFLRWLPPDKKWRENAGKIFMTVEADGSSFLVHRLEYHSNRSD